MYDLQSNLKYPYSTLVADVASQVQQKCLCADHSIAQIQEFLVKCQLLLKLFQPTV